MNQKNKIMKKSLNTLLVVLFATFNINAQGVLDRIDPTNSGALYRNSTLNKNNLDKIQGSQYFVEEFKLAEVSGVKQNLMVCYNAYTDQVEIENENKEVFSLTKKNPYQTIFISSIQKKIKLINYKSDNNEINGYLVELFNENEVSLYRKDKVNLEKGKEPKNSYESSVPSRMVKANGEYYLGLNGELPIQISKNKKQIQELFPEKKEELSAFFKKNEYSLKDEMSLIKTAKFLSSL